MKKALLVLSFGTSVPAARKSIFAVEEALKAVSDRDFFRAFTSPTIRRILARKGETVWSLPEALEALEEMGYADVAIQPTHLLYGYEYDNIRETVTQWNGRFPVLRLGQPLLATQEDLFCLGDCVTKAYAPEDGVLVLMGHGTAHFANMVYPAFQTVLRSRGHENVLVGTVEGWPDFDEVQAGLQAMGKKQVLLAPLMLVAGDHALNDMAGEDGWKGQLEQSGFQVSCIMEGLGMLEPIQQMYAAKCKTLLENEHGL